MAAKPPTVTVTLRKLESAYARLMEAKEAAEQCIAHLEQVLKERDAAIILLKADINQLKLQRKEQKK